MDIEVGFYPEPRVSLHMVRIGNELCNVFHVFKLNLCFLSCVFIAYYMNVACFAVPPARRSGVTGQLSEITFYMVALALAAALFLLLLLPVLQGSLMRLLNLTGRGRIMIWKRLCSIFFLFLF